MLSDARRDGPLSVCGQIERDNANTLKLLKQLQDATCVKISDTEAQKSDGVRKLLGLSRGALEGRCHRSNGHLTAGRIRRGVLRQVQIFDWRFPKRFLAIV